MIIERTETGFKVIQEVVTEYSENEIRGLVNKLRQESDNASLAYQNALEIVSVDPTFKIKLG